MDVPPVLGGQCEEDPGWTHTSHECECIIIVNSFLLDETARKKPCLVLDHLPHLVLLQLGHPFKGDRAVAVR